MKPQQISKRQGLKKAESSDAEKEQRESTTEKALFWALVVDVCVLAIFGGPSPSFLIIVPLVFNAIAITILSSFRGADGLRPSSTSLRVVMTALVALPALQLIPLPPAWWQALPDGLLRRDVLALVGKSHDWEPLSLVPLDTAAAVLLAFSFVALVSGSVALSGTRFRQLIYTIGIIVAASFAIGIVQAATGGQPHLLVDADHGDFLGFFANKNHAGLEIAAGLAMFVLIIHQLQPLRARSATWLIAAMILAFICAIATNSRAGLILTLAVCLWIVVRFIGAGRPWVRASIVVGGVLVTALVSFSPVFDQIYRRFDDVNQDSRWQFVAQSKPLAEKFVKLGAGGGSFSRLFIVHERLEWVKPIYVNEAHNEYLQTVIEYGLPGILLLFASCFFLARIGIAFWRVEKPGSSERRSLEVGAVIVLLYAAHSAIDYPLRRPASWVIFAAGCSLIVRGGSFGRRLREGHHRRD